MTTFSSLTKLTWLIIACGLTLNVFLSTTSANAAAKVASSPKPVCGIEIDNAHISRHMLRIKNTRGVLVSTRSSCDVLHSQVFLGQWKYAGHVRSEKTIEINCGT